MFLGRPRPLCAVVGPPEELVGHCVRQEAGLDGPLVRSSRVLLMFLGRPRPLCIVVGPPWELVGRCVRQDAGLDGPLV